VKFLKRFVQFHKIFRLRGVLLFFSRAISSDIKGGEAVMKTKFFVLLGTLAASSF